jgi:tripartite-type tricarboxylate transporter receptor subunit TctC
MSIRLAAVVSTALSCTLFPGLALGQAYPNKPIRVTTAGAGGGLDTMLRLIANGISGSLGQSIVVENRPATIFPQDRIAQGVPDGYSLGYFANTVWLGPFLRANLPYDPIKTFTPISLTAMIPNVLAVPAQLPVHSVAELVTLAKAKPGELNAYIAGGGSPTLSMLLFQSVTGAKFTTIRYKSVPQGMNDVAAGTLHVMFPTITSAAPLIKAGKVKALAVTSLERSAQAPELPTLAASGYPRFESVSVHAMLAPPKTPVAIVNRLNQEVVKFLSQSDAKARIGGMGIDVVASSPAYLGKFMQSEMARMGPVFREAGIKPGDMAE